jgi:5-methylcytosine-specific restriction endonuclease McrA
MSAKVELSVEQLEKLLKAAKRKAAYEKTKAKQRKTKVAQDPSPKNRPTLRRLTKKEQEKAAHDQLVADSKVKGKKYIERETAKRAKTDLKRKAEGYFVPKGKYVAKLTWVQITMSYKVILFNGGKIEGYRTESVDDFVGIRWNENRPATYTVKIRRAKDAMLNKFATILESNADLDPPSVKYKVEVMKDKRELKHHIRDPKDIKMLGAPKYDEVAQAKLNGEPIQYKFIPAEINKPKGIYTCTDSYLMQEYSKSIPSLCQEKMDEIMGKINPALGRSCVELDKFCEHYSISHYALDWKHKVFWKELRGSRNYKALIYYNVNSHLYPVTDPKTRESITKRCAAKSSKCTSGTNLKASLSEAAEIVNEAALIKLFERPCFEDVPVSKILEYSNCNIFYHVGSLHDLLIDLFIETSTAYESKYTADKMTCIIIPDKKISLFANMNHRSSNPDKKENGKNVPYDYKDVRRECEALKVPFMNQSFTSLGKMVQSRYDSRGKKKCIRVQFTKAQRERIWEKQGKKCSCCGVKLSVGSFEIDHIVPLSRQGSNDESNLQALCRKCHQTKTNKEAAERCFDTDNTQSDFNEDTLQVFKVVKNGFIHNFDPEKVWKLRVKKGLTTILGFDITKCRTETALRMDSEWCVFSVFDDVQPFDSEKHEKIPTGYYRVETDNYLPFKGPGWYSYPLVRKALEEEVIDLDDITHCVLPSLTLPANYYAKFIEYVRAHVNNKNLAKPIVNMFIGSLGHKVTKHRKVFLTTSINEACYHKYSVAEDDNLKIHVKMNTKAEGLIEVVQNSTRYVESNHVPIFNQILDEEAWQLYLITKLLKKHNCRNMIYYNTDNAIAEFTDPEDAEACKKEGLKVFWDKEKEFPKYKVQTDIHNLDRVERDEHGDNLVEKLAAGKVVRPFEMRKLKYQQLYHDEGSNDFSGFIRKLVKYNQSFQIQGRAGTGKSFMLKRFMEYLDYKGLKCLSLCPTHKACRSLDSELNVENHKSHTLDSQWSIIKHSGSDPFSHYDFVIIDEKSLVKEGFWKQILQIKHRFPKSRFVVCGDWAQLPPVGDRLTDVSYENSKAMWEICDGNMVEITHCRRMNKEGQKLFDMCRDVNAVNLKQFPKLELERSLAYTNSVRKAVNARWMEKNSKGKEFITVPAVAGMEKHTQESRIFVGLPVIAIDTDKKLNIVNAEEFVVLELSKKGITIAVTLEDESIDYETQVTVPVNRFPHLLQPAYCISSHRSQCSTIRVPYTIYQTKFMREMDEKRGGDLGKRLLYVSLSRAADIKLINISNEY